VAGSFEQDFHKMLGIPLPVGSQYLVKKCLAPWT
jgi:hypothetical protein